MLSIEYSQDDGASWQDYRQAVTVAGPLWIRSKGPNGQVSRIDVVGTAGI